jgi:hypothetical protein
MAEGALAELLDQFGQMVLAWCQVGVDLSGRPSR